MLLKAKNILYFLDLLDPSIDKEERELQLEKMLVDTFAEKYHGLCIREIDSNTLELGHPYKTMEIDQDASNVINIHFTNNNSNLDLNIFS